MNRGILIILVSILVISAIVFAVWFILRPAAPATPIEQPVSFPSATSTSTDVDAAEKSFLDSPQVHADPNNPGYYFVGPQPGDADGGAYEILYISETKYFNVAILEEPIGANRQKAESFLAQLLGATKEQMCALDYAVYVPNEVNTQYSGMNLGFSYCPGAVKLPL
jgi:hypothetical protein